jgi:hypothetical protein
MTFFVKKTLVQHFVKIRQTFLSLVLGHHQTLSGRGDGEPTKVASA